MKLAEARGRMSREDLARKASINVRTIYNIEHELTVPQRSTRALLALALGRRQDEISWPTETRQEAA